MRPGTAIGTREMATSLTKRRDFIVGVSCSVLGLYGLWALLDSPNPGPAAAGHGGHGDHGGAAGEVSPTAFRAMAEQFIAANSLPDGSVQPGLAHDPSDHSEHGGSSGTGPPVDVYLVATRWLFEPAVIRLAVGRTYRFRMMAMDVAHGASIQLGRGSRMIRLPAGVLNEQLLTFTEPGQHLLYCTMFCGPGHDLMSGRILVSA